MSLARYLAELEMSFQAHGGADGDVLEELRSHLEDCVYNLRLEGLSVTQSEQEALRRFGAPDDVLHAYAALPPPHAPHKTASRRWRARGAGMVLLVVLLAAATLSGGIAAAALASDHPAISPVPQHTTISAPLYRHAQTPAHATGSR